MKGCKKFLVAGLLLLAVGGVIAAPIKPPIATSATMPPKMNSFALPVLVIIKFTNYEQKSKLNRRDQKTK